MMHTSRNKRLHAYYVHVTSSNPLVINIQFYYFFIPQTERVPCCDDGIEFIDEGMVKIQDVESMSKERPMTSHTGKRV